MCIDPSSQYDNGQASYACTYTWTFEWVPSNPTDIPNLGTTYPVVLKRTQSTAAAIWGEVFPGSASFAQTSVYDDQILRTSAYATVDMDGILSNANSYGPVTSSSNGGVSFTLVNGKYIGTWTYYDFACTITFNANLAEDFGYVEMKNSYSNNTVWINQIDGVVVQN